ncbi:MAG: aryl-sulfate sulfotransferase [Sedimentisphaerales bacterium]|nr:aryl-sulfate sulfotransferase [Sedimentisphaerales bacterium]
MKAIQFLVVLSISLTLVSAAFAADSIGVPSDFPNLIVNQYGETAPGVLIGYFGSYNSDYYVVLDQSGYPLFYSKTDQMSYPGVMFNGLISAQGYTYSNPSRAKGYTLKDETFTVVDSVELVGDYTFDIHDLKVLPNGHALLLGTYPIPMDMSKLVSGGRPDASITGNVIQEIDADKNVVFEWHVIDHLPVLDSFHNLTAQSIDYAHFNSVSIDPFDNSLLISFRTTSEITKVSRSTGEVIWRLGGKGNQFTFIGEHEENAPYYFVGQHCIWRRRNGNLIFFDNGNIQGGGVNPCDRTYSRAVEYAIDETNMTATLVWEYRNTPDISTPSNGRVQVLSNGNVFIDWGSATQNKASVPIATEVSPEGELVYEMFFDSYTKGARLQKYLWNSPDLVKSQSFQNITSGNTYNASQAGATIIVDSLEGKINNGLAVKRHADAVRFPKFTGPVPQVLIERETISSFGIKDILFDVNFDIDGMDFKDPNQMTVYHRPQEDSGIFSPLSTYYDSQLKKLVVSDASCGEFIFTYPDVQGLPIAPKIKTPADMSAVSYTNPVTFEWAPGGLFKSFHLQVAKDEGFTEIVVDEPNLTEFKYIMETVEPLTTYFWRVNTTNDSGTGEWANASVTAVAPEITVTTPNGGEEWRKGLSYFIQWDYNMDDEVAIDLYNSSMFAKTIATVTGSQAYEWEVDLNLRTGSSYTIKVRSTADDTISDTSDGPFSITK